MGEGCVGEMGTWGEDVEYPDVETKRGEERTRVGGLVV
jgi:hypothetical protein